MKSNPRTREQQPARVENPVMRATREMMTSFLHKKKKYDNIKKYAMELIAPLPTDRWKDTNSLIV